MSLSSLDDSSSRVILGLMIPGICLTTVLLILYAYAAWNPISRRYLDRVSFRLLVYALLAHLVYGTFFVVGALAASSGWRCRLFAFVTNLSLMFSAGMFFCMALNLPLVLAYHVNGQKMEKYYILGTAFICLVCNLPPYASGNLGLYAVDGSETCWYRGPNRASIRGWLIGTQTFWMLLASTGEVTSFFIIVGYLIVHELDTRYFRTDTRLSASCDSGVPRPPGSTIRRFRNIILRIGLYPLVSCLINISTSVLDLYVMMHPEAPLTWRLNIGDLAIYAARPLIYGLLAATDPSFLRAFKVLRHPDSETNSATQPRNAYVMTTVIEMPAEEALDTSHAFEADKDDARGYVQRPALSDLEEGKEHERGMDEGDVQIVITAIAPPSQRPSTIDVVYHI